MEKSASSARRSTSAAALAALFAFFALFALASLSALGAFSVFALSSCSLGDPGNAGDPTAGNGAGIGEGADGGDNGGGGLLDAAAADEAVYTQPTFSIETQEQIDQFLLAADELPMDDARSATSLFQTFRFLAFDSQPNDGLFFAYESAMQSIGDSLNESIDENGLPGDDAINSAIENGFMFVNETDNPHFSLRPDFLCDTFYNYVSGTVKDLLALRKKHFEFAGGHEFLENDTIMVTLNQLAEMIVDWEGYLNARNVADIYEADAIRYNLDFYLKIFVGAYQIENSGFYVDIGTDIEGRQMLKLADEPRQCYLMFIENYQNSAYWPIVSELFQVYQAHDFLYTVDIENFFDKHGLTVPV